ncbi:hypothetical protein [Nocardia sp. alder85J]|uniref:hypothetical protein n=1 Tax=Nocardia sp. alder85J TaxID=2862949 RepID=UPI001CD7B63C|nr:hypothetical protein [Nocardia sp. alder85J]MCX4095772.1 hypothetical protein [Nocardia sp. alder85J]
MNSAARDAALWYVVGRALWFLTRRLRGRGLELARSGTPEVVRARRGEPSVRLTGPPGEVLLYLFGRTGAAEVDLDAPGATTAMAVAAGSQSVAPARRAWCCIMAMTAPSGGGPYLVAMSPWTSVGPQRSE